MITEAPENYFKNGKPYYVSNLENFKLSIH
jgi:hypothetical protein